MGPLFPCVAGGPKTNETLFFSGAYELVAGAGVAGVVGVGSTRRVPSGRSTGMGGQLN